MNEINSSVLDGLMREVLDSIHLIQKPKTEAAGGPMAVSWVRLVGEQTCWVVSLECSEHLLRSTTGVIFSKDPGGVSWYQMQSTLGEMVNMVSGNVKGIAGRFKTMSLPTISIEEGRAVRVPEGTVLLQATLDYLNGQVRVTILEAGKSASTV